MPKWSDFARARARVGGLDATYLTVRQNGRVSLWNGLRHTAQGAAVETVTDQLTDQFGIGNQGAHTLAGLGARVEAKLTAHTLGLALNWQMGKAAWLQIKALAFPISHMTLFVSLWLNPPVFASVLIPLPH